VSDPGAYYSRLVDAYRLHLRIVDTDPLDVCLAALITSKWDGDPLWVYVVGPPSTGKTEILRMFSDLDSAYCLSSLTPNCLVSGLKDGHDLLPALDGKTLVVKDLTMTLEMHRENRDALFGALRDAYDGSFAKAFGTVGTKRVESHFNLLAAVTGAIENYYSVQVVLGQRFLIVRTSFPADDFEADDHRDIEPVRTNLRELVRDLIRERLAQPDRPPMSDEFGRECKQLANEVALLRASVHRDGYTHVITGPPEPEGPSRMTNQFVKLARGLAWIRAKAEVTAEEMAVVRRVARDTIPAIRTRIVKTVNDGAPTIDAIASVTRLPRRTIERKVEDLVMLGVLVEDSTVKPYLYSVATLAAPLSIISTEASGGAT
jgi:hypothetical protein